MPSPSGRTCGSWCVPSLAGFVLLWSVVLTPTSAAAASRAAPVGSGEQRIGQVLSLAEARLTEAGTVQLVERREIDRVLAEQKLSVGGLVRAEQAVGVGKILSAE